MEQNKPYYLTFLERLLQERKSANAAYSLRAFARSLDVDSGDLSRILAGKLPLTLKTGERITQKLELAQAESREFLLSIVSEKARIETDRICAMISVAKTEKNDHVP